MYCKIPDSTPKQNYIHVEIQHRFEEFQTRIENEPLKLLSYIFEQVEILRLKPSPKHTYVMFPAK